MKDHVFIKSSKYGLEVFLDPDLPFEELSTALLRKFTQAAKFFHKAKLAISFEGRDLSTKEEQILIDIITKAANIELLCMIDNHQDTKEKYRAIIDGKILGDNNKEAQYYKGTLKKRQVLESDKNIIIIGNIDSGAKVISRGNIIVLGEIKGDVHAGLGGKEDSYIVGLSFKAKSLKIKDYFANRQTLQNKNDIPNIPKIATIVGKNIYIDPLL